MRFIVNKSSVMLKFCKTILKKVSFDKTLFRKELRKSVNILNKKEIIALKIWCLSYYGIYKDLIIEEFETISTN